MGTDKNETVVVEKGGLKTVNKIILCNVIEILYK